MGSWDSLTPAQIEGIEEQDLIEAGAEVEAPAVHTTPKSGGGDNPGPGDMIIAENAEDAGCYRFLSEHFYVDTDHEDLVTQIRKLADPRYVLLICKRVYRSPAGTEVVVSYPVTSKYIPNPQPGYEDAYVRLESVPRGFPFPPDKIQTLRTHWVTWDQRDPVTRAYLFPTEYNNNTPPAPVQIGPWLLTQLCAVRKFFDSAIRIDGDRVSQGDFENDKLAEIVNAETLADAKRVEDARAELRYRVANNWSQFKDAMSNERWSPKPEEPPLFLDLGKKG